MIDCRVKELIDQKYGGAENVNLSEVQRDTGLTYVTVLKWYKETPNRVDFPTLEAWCKFLDCGICDLLVLRADTPEEAAKPKRKVGRKPTVR